jgi:DNA-binding SARP family transcriptional activator
MSRDAGHPVPPAPTPDLRIGDSPTPEPGPTFWVAAVLWVASIGLAAWSAPVDPTIFAWVSFTTVGTLLVWLKPGHPVGWLLIVDGLVWTGGSAADRYVQLPSSTGLPEALAAASFDLVGWIVAIGLVPLALLLVPTGRFLGRWDRVAAFLLVAGGGLLAVVGMITFDQLPSKPSISNPFQVLGSLDWLAALQRPAELAFMFGLIGALATLIVRFVGSSGVVRQQLRWLAFAGATMLSGFVVGELLNAFGLPGEAWANTLPMLTAPVAVGVAVLRYRLWDLDRVIRGTLIYGVVALAVTAIYVALVAGVGAVAERGGAETWLAILATAIAATLFQPIRLGAASAINRFVTKRRPDVPALMIRTLGGFRVERQGVAVSLSEWRSKRARQLLKMLVAQRGRPLHREQAMAALWPRDDSENLANRLSVALSTLRSVLDPDKGHGADHYVLGQDDTLQLRYDHLTVDLEHFMTRAAAAGSLAEIREADNLYRGDFLVEDLYEDWAGSAREEARAVYLDLLRRRAELSQDLHPAEAHETWLRVLEVDPWDESAHLCLISVLETAGRHGEARRARKRYEELMRDIGVSPQPR